MSGSIESVPSPHSVSSVEESQLETPGVTASCQQNLVWFGLDIGGTLCKSVYFETMTSQDKLTEVKSNGDPIDIQNLRNYLMSSETYGSSGIRDSKLVLEGVSIGPLKGNLHFMKFETHRMKGALELAGKFNNVSKVVLATGGGAYKYKEDFKQNLGVELIQYDEFHSLVIGIHFILNNVDKEIFYWDNPNFSDTPEKRYLSVGPAGVYPYLVVNIGSGVSIILVRSQKDIERVGGTSVGGGTFLGLTSLLTGVTSFDAAIALAEGGDHTKVDKLVRDIYGGSYEQFGLPGTLVASSFGNMNLDDKRAEATKEDLAKACLITVTNNVGSIALLCARISKVERILFVGNYLKNNAMSMRQLAYAVEYWSAGKNKALFLEHEGYFGAVGTLLQHMN